MLFDISKVVIRMFRYMALLGLFLGTASVANAGAPAISIFLNPPTHGLSYATGETMSVSVATAPGNPPTSSDVYIALQLPDGTLLFMQPGGGFSTTMTPLVSSMSVPSFIGPIFNYAFTGAEPTGAYTWFAALMQPGTMNVVGTLSAQTFSFAPVPATRLPNDVAIVPYTSSQLVDVDGDGDLDMYLGPMWRFTKDELLLNDGTGHFNHAPATSLPLRYGGSNWGAVSAYSADFDNDGDNDLLLSLVDLSYSQGYLQLLLNNGTGTFTDASSKIPQSLNGGWRHEIRIADLDGDGLLDFITGGSYSNQTTIFRNTGNAVFVQDSIYNVTRYYSSAIGDVNGDQKPDIVQITTNSLSVGINASTPGAITFNKTTSTIAACSIQTSALIDFDNDGDLDLIANCYYDPTGGALYEIPSPIYAFRNDGLGNFTDATSVVLPSAPTSILAEYMFADDFNGDGLSDIFIAENGPHYDSQSNGQPGGQSKLLIQNGFGVLEDKTALLLPNDSAGAAHGATYGDIDGDGDLDVYLSNINPMLYDGPYFFINNGTGAFTKEQ